MISLIERAHHFPERTAVRSGGQAYPYQYLLDASARIASGLLSRRSSLNGERIAFLIPGSVEYVCVQWAIWRVGGVAVPLSPVYPMDSIQYVLKDTGSKTLIINEKSGGDKTFDQLSGVRIRDISEMMDHPGTILPQVDPEQNAMILYTSGTTSLPKGVVTTHSIIQAQIQTLVDAWEWAPDDHILCVLPLHHVHGIINVTSCALWSGACVEFLPEFDPGQVFECFLEGNINLFMAVPTIYYKLIAHWKQLGQGRQMAISDCLSAFRLMVSGSAALPVKVLEEWESISGHTLLERYGMTEIGMAVSNPYHGERRPGHIESPLPGVLLRLVDEQNQPVEEGSPGEIQVQGPNVFKEYWQKPEATAAAYSEDGWFRTGDIAMLNNGSYKILGRNSVDIIKSGGYKISALEIEEVLRTYDGISDCAVVGIEDEEWGEVVAAGLLPTTENVDLEALQKWLRQKLPAYKLPRQFVICDHLPRNALGKVTKNELKKQFIS